MPKRARLVLLMIGLTLVPLAVLAAIFKKQSPPPPPPNVALETNIVFGKGGKQPLHLDITTPKEGKGPFPALVMVHGGGWIGGDKESLRGFQYHFSQRGIVCISVQYRFAPKNAFPAQIEDVKCAVRWVRANAAKYNIDPKRIGALGGSAGAHLVALLGTTSDKKIWEGTGGNPTQSSAICAMVCMSGPYDLPLFQRTLPQSKATKAEQQGLQAALDGLLPGPEASRMGRFQKASPIHYASKKTVPTLLTHGPNDTLVPMEQSEAFEARLKKVSAKVELLRMEGAGHADFGTKPEVAIARITAFVEKYLKKS